MRIKIKKLSQPANIKQFIDSVIAAPPGGLAAALEGFRWNFEKGDFNHWTPLFNHFDAFLEKHTTPRQDLQLDWTDGTPDPPVPTAEVLAILRVTAAILENCSNKHLYQSTEHLAALLAAEDQAVVASALAALMALFRKSHSGSTRFAGETDLNKRLLAIAQGWGGKEQGLDLLACANEDESAIQQGMHKAERLHFSFYRATSQAGRSEDQIGLDSAGGLCTIDVPTVPSLPATEHGFLRQLIQQHNVPKYLRFKLLCQIRVTYRFATLEGRRQLVANRLMAFVVYMQANPSHEELATFFMGETELISELISLVEADAGVDEAIRMLALKALAVQLLDRQRHNAVITALSAGGQSGLLATLMRSSVTSMTDPGASPGMLVSIGFVEALFSLIGALVASTTGCSALASAGLIPAFLPMLKDVEPSHLHLVNTAVRIMETYMDFVTTASTLFRDLGGLTQMIARIDLETRAGSAPIPPSGGPETSSVALALQAPAGQPGTAAGTVPYARRNLLKSLLRAVALASYSPGSGARPQEQDQEELFKCLRRIMDQSQEFGGNLFSLAASVMTDLIHHDPLVFRSLDKAGLPQAFISAIKAGVMPAGDAIACVPTTLVAICLNTAGAERVKNSGALECLVPVFTTPTYIRALNGETIGSLGTGLDELMRHVPSLRESVIDVLLKILRALARQGNRWTPPASSSGAAATAVDAAQPMETDGSAASGATVEGPSGNTAEAESTSAQSFERAQQLGEMIQRTARVLEAQLGNMESTRLFVQRGGVQALLPLYELPLLEPSFGSHSPLHALTSALRALAQTPSQKHISKLLAAALQSRLKVMRPMAEATKEMSIPCLPEAQRDQYTRQLQMTEGLLSVAASVARMSVDLLAEISKGDQSITAQISELERIIVKQTTLAQEWKAARDAAKAAEAAQKEGEQAASQPEAPETPQEAAAEPAAEPAAGAAAAQDDDAMQDGPSDDGAAPQGDPLVEPGPGKHRKRTSQELAYDALIQFASTARLFYVQIAKAIHNPSRRREEAPGTPSMPMQAAAAVVSITMRDALTSAREMWPGLYQALPEECVQRPLPTAQLANYITHMAGGLGNTLFDSRRRTCHSLVLNYFVAGNGLPILLEHFTLAVGLLRVTAAIQVPPHPDGKPGEEKPSHEKLLKTAVEGTVRMFLQLLDHLVNAEQLLSSPQAATLLLTPIPGSKAAPEQTSAEELVRVIQSAVSAAVLPLWADPELAATSPEVAQRIVSIMTKCINGTSRVTVPSLARAGIRATYQPDASVVQQIVEMGFSAARAEEALRRVQHNSVELAMEWLINHPEEAGAGAAAAAAAAAAPPPDTELVQSFSGIINRAEPSTSAAPAKAATPGPVQLVDGAVGMLAKAPAAAFSLADLLAALCKQNGGENSRAVLEKLVELLRGLMDGAPCSASRTPASLQAPAHLLAVLTAEDPSLLHIIHEQGGFGVALDLIEQWLKEAVGYDPGKTSLLLEVDSTSRSPTPAWIDALLLVLDQAIKVQPKPATAAASAPPQPHGPPADRLSALMADSPSTKGEAPRAEAEKPAGAEKAAVAEDDAAVASLHATIASMYSSGGLLSEEEQQRATSICICLLKFLHQWGGAAKPADQAVETTQSTPGSHAQAVLQLLARLTKRHSLALQALSGKVHHLVLSLPAAALKPEHAAHMCAIMRHLLEDPATLQAAMEAEIRSTLTARGPTRNATDAQTSMGLRQFLTATATVIGRDPTVFFEALLATCCVVRVAGRPIIQLKSPQKSSRPGSSKPAATAPEEAGKGREAEPQAQPQQPAAGQPEAAPGGSAARPAQRRRASVDTRTPKQQKDAGKDAQPKSAVKGSRKTVPASFVEVIDTLLDAVSNYQGVILSADTKPEENAESSSMQEDQPAADTHQQPGRADANPASGSSTAAAAGNASRATAAAAEDALAALDKAELRPKERAVLLQCIALKMLTDFTLMYTATVGVILRRDAESLSYKGGSPRARTPAARRDSSKQTGALFRHILAAHLAHDPEPGWAMQSLAQQASHFLLAVSIRSAEGRRRIVGCIVDGLTGRPPLDQQSLQGAPKPPLYKVKALVELITSLMCINPGNTAPRAGGPNSATHFQEMMRAMVDAGVRKALLEVLKGLDVNHPKAPQLINTILKPFEVLTRSFLWRSKPSTDTSAKPVEAAPPAAGEAPACEDEAQAAPATSAAPRTEAGSTEGGHDQDEPEAGPEALAAAQQAIEQYDRRHELDNVGPEHARDLEDMVEAIMEQAYAEDMLDDYGTVSEGSEHSDEEMEDEEAMAEGALSGDEHDAMDDSGESGEEDHDDDEMSEDYSSSEPSGGSEDDPLDHHGLPEDAAVLLDGDDPDDDGEDGFIDGEEDGADAEDHLVLDGPDFNVLDNAFQQDLEAAHEGGLNEEDVDAQFEEHEGWDDEEDEDEEEDEDALLEDAHEIDTNDLPDDSIQWEMDAHAPRGGGFSGIAGLQNPTQAMIEELFGSLGRAGLGALEHRRYRVITQQLPSTGAPRPRRPAQHMLLRRPAPALTFAASQGASSGRELHPMATALMNQLGLHRHQASQLGMFASDRHGGGYLIFPDGRGLAGGAGPPQRFGVLAGAAAALQPGMQDTSSVLTSSIEMLMGGSGANGRQESRMANWSDDGLPPANPTSAAPDLVAGTLEQQLAAVLSQNTPQEPPAAGSDGAAAGDGPAPAGQPRDNGPVMWREARREVVDPPETRPQGTALAAQQPDAPPPEPTPAASTPAPSAPEAGAEPAPALPPAEVAEPSPTAHEESEADQEMADVGPAAGAAAAEEAAVPRAEDIDMGSPSDGAVDQAFLDALPADLRAEMVAAQAGRLAQPAGQPQQPPPAPSTQATPPEPASAAAAAAPAGAAAAPAEPARQENDEMDGIDPEFIAALPPELQAEVLEQQRRERRLRQAAARRAEAQQQAAAAPAGGGPAEMDMATILATFPPEVREEVLLTSDDSLLATLTPALLAEAQNLRERALRSHRDTLGSGGGIGGLGRSLMQQVGREARGPGEERGSGGVPASGTGRLAGRRSMADSMGMGELDDRQEDGEGPAPIDEGDVEVLVSLLRLPQPLAKQTLQRVFLNLCGHQQTRQAALQLLVSLLRAPAAGEAGSPSMGGPGVDEDLLQPVSSKRFLDLLINLARFKPRVARELPALSVPMPAEQDPKGKAIAAPAPDVPAIQVLFGLLGSTLCLRSNSHLILALHLLEIIMGACKQQPARPAGGSRELPMVPENEEPSPAPGTAQAAAGAEPSNVPMEGAHDGAVPMEAAPEHGQPSQGRGGPSSALQAERQAGSRAGPSGGSAAQDAVRGAAAREAISRLPQDQVQQISRLLGRQRLSELPCTRVAAVALLLVECAPGHREALLAALDRELQRCGQEAAGELQRMADASFGSRAGQAGAPVLRILQTLTSLCKANSAQASAEAQKAALDTIASRLESLWGILSQCISRIEDSLGQQTPQQEQAHLLPPEAAQVLPFVEAFFVLCDARTAHLPQPEPGLLRAASSELARSEFARSASLSNPSMLAPSSSGQVAHQPRGVLDAHLPFLRFAEKHRRLLNALLRQHPNLLEGSLAPLLRVARLIDFDNKRAYFRTKVRAQGAERHYGSLRINVRREHVFEDSFHQLRVRSPEEMRAKLSVHFQGEEGIDAGGVSREWYQVMAREIFNPNFSLFVPVPEGGTTFQPNPNSIVQNDEARGTNHLDFFKFVGRVVGKALYDGLFVDAYFTRSLYKHMLDQRLTYMDIEAVDPEYFKNLAWMLGNDITDVLDLTFTEEVDYFGRKELKELKPGGRELRVTEANKREYVNLVATHHMTTAIRSQLDAFLGGFWDLIPKELVKIFNDHELELLISGLPEIDVDDLRANTDYSGYTAATTVIQWFWELVRSLEKQDLALLVQFVTGTSKVPLEGFKALQGISGPQKFQIHKAYGAQDRLPSAHTCFNQLDLIEYDSIDLLRARLLTAIREGTEGFGFG